MTSPAPPVIAQPDLEAFVWQQVRVIPGTTSFTYAVVHNDHLPWVVAYSIQVDSRATTKEAAKDRSELVRQIMWGLPQVPWAEGVVCYMQAIEGPFWMPDPDGGPRYCARYDVRCHPVPSGSLGKMPRADAAGPVGRKGKQ